MPAGALFSSDQNKIKPTKPLSMHIPLCRSLLSVTWDRRRTQQRLEHPIQTYRYPQFHRDLPAKIRKKTKQANTSTPLVRTQAQTVTLKHIQFLLSQLSGKAKVTREREEED